MPKVELHLSEDTFQRARRSATDSQTTLEHWLTQAVERAAAPPFGDNPLLGLFADAPDLIDTLTEDAMTTREQQPWRASPEEQHFG